MFVVGVVLAIGIAGVDRGALGVAGVVALSVGGDHGGRCVFLSARGLVIAGAAIGVPSAIGSLREQG